MSDALATFGTRFTPQMEKARADQVENLAGGYVFGISDMTRAARFLIMGSAGGSYYASEHELTKENTDFVISLANGPNAAELLALVLDVSLKGRAAKQNPTVFTLAALCASKDLDVRRAAIWAIPQVCRTGTMLFLFARYVENFRGWGRALRNGVARWYTAKTADDLAWQATKYRQREGWTHRDLLRLSHPTAPSVAHKAAYDWICGRGQPDTPAVIMATVKASLTTDPKLWAQLVSEHRLSWEQLPDEALSKPEVWDAMIPTLGITALVRQLGRLASMDYTKPFSNGARMVAARLSDKEAIRKSRIHPLTVLLGAATYGTGHGQRGHLSWAPSLPVLEVLDALFYESFGNVEPAGKRTLLGLDVSGSMGSAFSGSVLSCVEAEMALAMVTVRSEPETYPMAFSSGFVPLALTRSTTLRDAVRTAQQMPFERTDCAVPMMWASQHKIPVDTFVISTDNETWCGSVHPFQALRRYRDIMGIPARLAVIGMVSNGFTIADPSDAGMLDLVGFDTSTPAILTEFSAGRL